MTLSGRDYREAAIKLYDDLIGRFGAATELSLREYVARALINKADDVVALDHKDLALSVYDDLIGRFGAAIELSLRKYVAQALFRKHGLHLDAHDWQNAVAVCDDMIARFGGATELSLREYVARARLKKAEGLDRLGRSEEAVAVLKDFQGHFGTTSELWLLKMVKEANNTEKEYLKREKAKRESERKAGIAAIAGQEPEQKRRRIQENRRRWIAIGGPPVLALIIGLSVSLSSMIGADAGRRTFLAAFYTLLAIFIGLMFWCAELPGVGSGKRSFKWVGVIALTIGLSALTVSTIGPGYMRGTGTLTFVAVCSMVLGMYSGLMVLYAERDAEWKWKRIVLVCVVVAALIIVVGMIAPQPPLTPSPKDLARDLGSQEGAAPSLWLSLMFVATLSILTAIYSILMLLVGDVFVLRNETKRSNWTLYAIGWLMAGFLMMFLGSFLANKGIMFLTTTVSAASLISLALAIFSGLRLMFLYLELC